ncbi:hypothetical protein C8R47DRAFT_640934 [Mycena vitilis]|nr:hypothetical protein C8R47DRAFT_640934 [Mycena vitilis]
MHSLACERRASRREPADGSLALRSPLIARDGMSGSHTAASALYIGVQVSEEVKRRRAIRASAGYKVRCAHSFPVLGCVVRSIQTTPSSTTRLGTPRARSLRHVPCTDEPMKAGLLYFIDIIYAIGVSCDGDRAYEERKVCVSFALSFLLCLLPTYAVLGIDTACLRLALRSGALLYCALACERCGVFLYIPPSPLLVILPFFPFTFFFPVVSPVFSPHPPSRVLALMYSLFSVSITSSLLLHFICIA